MTERTETLCTSCSEITARGAECTSCGNDPEALMLRCEHCKNGRVQVMRAATARDFHPDACIVGDENCSFCHGVGEVEPEFVLEAEEWAAGYQEQLEKPMSGWHIFSLAQLEGKAPGLTVFGRGSMAAWVFVGLAAEGGAA